MASPLVGNAPLNAIAFGAYGNGMRTLDRYLAKPTGERARLIREEGRPQYWRLMLAGTWAGLVQCVVSVPTELVSCSRSLTAL